jgi:hypothetical protein
MFSSLFARLSRRSDSVLFVISSTAMTRIVAREVLPGEATEKRARALHVPENPAAFAASLNSDGRPMATSPDGALPPGCVNTHRYTVGGSLAVPDTILVSSTAGKSSDTGSVTLTSQSGLEADACNAATITSADTVMCLSLLSTHRRGRALCEVT